jgi:hypothetical protein
VKIIWFNLFRKWSIIPLAGVPIFYHDFVKLPKERSIAPLEYFIFALTYRKRLIPSSKRAEFVVLEKLAVVFGVNFDFT